MTEVSIPASAAIAATSRYDVRGLIRRTHGLLVPGILVIIWEAVVRAGWVSAHLLPPPSELVTTLADLAGNGTLIGHIGVSSLRVLIGFCIGTGLAGSHEHAGRDALERLPAIEGIAVGRE